MATKRPPSVSSLLRRIVADLPPNSDGNLEWVETESTGTDDSATNDALTSSISVSTRKSGFDEEKDFLSIDASRRRRRGLTVPNKETDDRRVIPGDPNEIFPRLIRNTKRTVEGIDVENPGIYPELEYAVETLAMLTILNNMFRAIPGSRVVYVDGSDPVDSIFIIMPDTEWNTTAYIHAFLVRT